MWIELKKGQYPTKEGEYKTLIEWDETGTLVENERDYFDGKDWCHYRSNRQFIRYWWSEEKAKQKELIIQIMESDEEAGLYE